VPQPDGTVLYELLTGHPDRAAHELVFVELRAWPYGTWATLGVDPQVVAGAVINAWRGGHLEGLQLGALTHEEVLALARPAMTYPTGALVGPGDIRAQARQVFDNLQAALQAVGASFEQVVKLNYYLVDATQLPVVREVRDRYVNTQQPPASTAVEVRRLARDDLLIEVEAVAVIASVQPVTGMA
jgi:enamine deaminase RidA (YjgF/YER057c/UK114 family)